MISSDNLLKSTLFNIKLLLGIVRSCIDGGFLSPVSGSLNKGY